MSDTQPVKQLLHLVFGGELDSVSKTEFKDLDKLDIVGVYPNYATAYMAWKAKAQGTVDNAQMRYFIVHCIACSSPRARRRSTEITDASMASDRTAALGQGDHRSGRRRISALRRDDHALHARARRHLCARRSGYADHPRLLARAASAGADGAPIQPSRQHAGVAASRRRGQCHCRAAARRRHDPRLGQPRRQFRAQGRSRRLSGDGGLCSPTAVPSRCRRMCRKWRASSEWALSSWRKRPAGRSIRAPSPRAAATCSTIGTAPPSICRSAAAPAWRRNL